MQEPAVQTRMSHLNSASACQGKFTSVAYCKQRAIAAAGDSGCTFLVKTFSSKTAQDGKKFALSSS